MKINIRKGVFETNSSSTHSLCIVSKKDYEKYKKGELIYFDDEKLVKFTEEIKKKLDEESEEYDEDAYYEYQTYEGLGYDRLETFEKKYKTKGGEELVAFGYHGQDC